MSKAKSKVKAKYATADGAMVGVGADVYWHDGRDCLAYTIVGNYRAERNAPNCWNYVGSCWSTQFLATVSRLVEDGDETVREEVRHMLRNHTRSRKDSPSR